MITLLHGDNIEASRNELHRLRSLARDKDIRVLDGKSLDSEHLVQALASPSLFGGGVLVVIENLFGKLGRKAKLITTVTNILKNASTDIDIIIWEDKDIGITVQKSLGTKVSIQAFKTPVLIFQFLDSIAPHRQKELLMLYEKLKQYEAAELILAMTNKRLRQLVMIADGVMPEGIAPWQGSKLTNQSKLFTINKLISMEQQLIAIEHNSKSGRSPFSLHSYLEYFFATL